MSLRDLATTALCAPTDASVGSSSAAGSSALVQLADAILPSTSAPPRPDHVASLSTAAIAADAGDPLLTHPDVAAAGVPSSAAVTSQLPSANPSNAPFLPPGLFPAPVHVPAPASVHAPAPVPVPIQGPPQPLPTPVAGDPTDLFERAFKSPLQHPAPAPAHAHAPAHAPASAPLSHGAPAPVARPASMHSWRHLNAPFHSALGYHSYGHPPMMVPVHAPPPPRLYVPPPVAAVLQPATAAVAGTTTTTATARTAATATATKTSDTATATTIAATTVQPQPVEEATSSALSWSEEFASLEAVESLSSQDVNPSLLHTMEDPSFHVDSDVLENPAFDETLQSAFQHWLRMGSSETYQFTNAPLDQSATSVRTAAEALQQGIHAHTEGRLSAAVYHLEEALQRHQANREELPKVKEALSWYVLGLCLADLDDDERAIQALTQGINVYNGNQTGHRREDNPYLWQSLIALAVSHTNELEHSKAFRVIREWLDLRNAAQNGDGEAGMPALGGIGGISSGSSTSHYEGVSAATHQPTNDLFRRISHEDLVTALNRAASQSPEDADLFIVLGILHNLNRDYERAATAFRHAAALRPETPGVWNKLGATLANGGDTDDALRAYRRAVDLQPALVRAWVNVGTAYTNRTESEKAIRYYLKAIAISKESTAENKALKAKAMHSGDSMQHVWGYLRSSLISLSRGDLLGLVESRDAEALRAHFNF